MGEGTHTSASPHIATGASLCGPYTAATKRNPFARQVVYRLHHGKESTILSGPKKLSGSGTGGAQAALPHRGYPCCDAE